ncbi:MAG: GDSL family lipase, partial [Oscillospiraceae bacterium]|nr:GDSL family lipase [Oscillospiraceae bacterium]
MSKKTLKKGFLKKLFSGLTASVLAFSGLSAMPEKLDFGMEAQAATTSWKFDLGGGGTASGYTGVSAGTAYSASAGYGFSGSVSNVTANGSGALSDAVKFTGGTFNVDLPKGLYQVTVTTGNVSRT